MTGELHRQWGSTLKIKRSEKGWSQAVFADKLGLKASSVCRWEQGVSAPSDDNKVLIAEVLGEDVRVLFPLVKVPA